MKETTYWVARSIEWKTASNSRQLESIITNKIDANLVEVVVNYKLNNVGSNNKITYTINSKGVLKVKNDHVTLINKEKKQDKTF